MEGSETTTDHIFLRYLIQGNSLLAREIKTRLRLKWSAFGKYGSILSGPLALCLKLADEHVLYYNTWIREVVRVHASGIETEECPKRTEDVDAENDCK